MSRKRRNTSSPEPESPRSLKRQNTSQFSADWDSSDDEDSKEVPQFNEYTGQTGAFPGLGNQDEELFYGPAADGIEYLRMVRSEAKGVPQVLTVPTTQSIGVKEEEDATQDDGGYYDDGTYTALANPSDHAEKALPAAQEYYYDSLLKQFKVVQATMRCTPPLAVIQRLSPSQLVSFPEESRRARQQWEAHLISTDPHPAQVACIDPQSVLELAKFLRRKLSLLLRHNDQRVVSRVGGWLWAVLAKCRDREVLSSEEVGELRQLAQRAILMQAKASSVSDQHVGTDDDVDSPHTNDEDTHSQNGYGGDEAASAINQEVHDPADEVRGDNTPEDKVVIGPDREKLIAVILDMVITVVGEVYGQRDLLESRKNWAETVILI